MKSKLLKSLFIIETFFMMFMPMVNIKAVNIGQDDTPGNGNQLKETPCSTATSGKPWNGCGTFDSDFAIRVTLVDKNGKRVENTKTIELINSDSNNMSYIGGTENSSKKLTQEEIIKNRYRSNIIKGILDSGEKSKFSSQTTIQTYQSRQYLFKNIGTTPTSTSMYIMFPGTTMTDGTTDVQEVYAAKIFEDNFTTPNIDTSLKYIAQKNSFLNYLKSGEANTEKLDGQSEKVNLLSFILYATGYADTVDAEDKWNLPIGTMYGKDYYLLIEPVHQLLFREEDNIRLIEGTAKQMLEFYAYNIAGQPYATKGFSRWVIRRGTAFYNLACSAFTSSQAKNTFGKTGIDNQCINETVFGYTYGNLYNATAPTQTFANSVYSISNNNNLYGVNIVSIDDEVKLKLDCEFVINKCTNTTDSTTEISFKLGELNKEYCSTKIPSLLEKIGIKESKCYDEIGIKTSEVTSNLNGTTLTPYTFLNIPTLDVVTTRKCSGKRTDSSSTTNNIDINAKLKILGNEYKYINVETSSSGPTTTKYGKETKTTQKYRLDDTQKGVYGKNGMLGIDVNNLLVQNNSYLEQKIIKHADEYSNYIYIKEQDTNKTYLTTDNQLEIGKEIKNMVGEESRKIISALENGKTIEIQKTEEEENKNITYIFSLSTEGDSMNCPFEPDVKTYPEIKNVKFRVISLDNPFPARDGTSRMPGKNWMTDMENNVYDYIQNNRGVTTNEVYNKEPLYTITLDTETMVRIRGYNQTHSYGNIEVDCEGSKGTSCLSSFLRNTNYIKKLEGTCAGVTKDNRLGSFYKCADKTDKSSGYDIYVMRK